MQDLKVLQFKKKLFHGLAQALKNRCHDFSELANHLRGRVLFIPFKKTKQDRLKGVPQPRQPAGKSGNRVF